MNELLEDQDGGAAVLVNGGLIAWCVLCECYRRWPC